MVSMSCSTIGTTRN